MEDIKITVSGEDTYGKATITTNDGMVFVTRSVEQFCKENNYNLSIIRKLCGLDRKDKRPYITKKKEYINWSATRKLKDYNNGNN